MIEKRSWKVDLVVVGGGGEGEGRKRVEVCCYAAFLGNRLAAGNGRVKQNNHDFKIILVIIIDQDGIDHDNNWSLIICELSALELVVVLFLYFCLQSRVKLGFYSPSSEFQDCCDSAQTLKSLCFRIWITFVFHCVKPAE